MMAGPANFKLPLSTGKTLLALQQIDPIAPNADVLVVPFRSLASQYPAELTVLAISTQVLLRKKYDALPKIGLISRSGFTIDYIGAYVASRYRISQPYTSISAPFQLTNERK
jgi:hypothetical protein